MRNRFDIKDVESLKLRFPDMFSGPTIHLEFYKGWFPDFVDLCFEIEALLGSYSDCFYWVQLKEKFGSYRMYGEFRPPLDYPRKDESCEDSKEAVDKFTPLKDEVRKRMVLAIDKINGKCCVCDPVRVPRHRSP